MRWFLLALQRWRDYGGRSRRREYWFFKLFSSLLLVMVNGIGSALPGGTAEGMAVRVAGLACGAAMLAPDMAVGWRRMHDIGRPGWFYPLLLIPTQVMTGGMMAGVFKGWDLTVLALTCVLLFLTCKEGEPGENRWGASPKG